MKKIISYIFATIAFATLIYFSYQTYTNAKELESINKSYYEAQTDIGSLIKRRFGSMLSTVTFGMVKNKNNSKVNLNELKAKKIVLNESNKSLIIKLSIVATIILLLFFIIENSTYAILLSLSSIVMLIFGIITPILMIVIHKYVNYLGDVVLSFESKTIIGTIEHLYQSHNYPVALVILLFSIIVPLIKSIIMLLVAIFKELHIAKKMLIFFKHLGKWSMLDVFVVSLLLVYLSMGSSQNSYSEIENGLYLFLIYVIYSIVTSIVVDRLVNKKEDL